MKSHDAYVDRSSPSPSISFSDTFNVSVALVDRHLTLGRGDKVVARGPRGSMTFTQLSQGVNRYAHALRQAGVGRGDRIMLLLPDRFEFYFAFLGAARIGAIAVLANTYLKTADYEYILKESEPKVLFTDSVSLKEVESALQQLQLRFVQKVCVDASPPAGWIAATDFSPETDVDYAEPEATAATTDCFILYSSGSTGKPKGCVHQHKDLIYLAVLYAENILSVTEEDVIVSIGKLFFAYGICNSLGFPLWTGCSVELIEDRATPEAVLEAIGRANATIYLTVPTALSSQIAAIEKGVKANLRSLRACVIGGEPLSPALFERWKQISGLELLEGVGSSEVLHIYLSNELKNPRIGTVGKAVPGFDVEIRGTDGKPVADGEIGEMVVRGESLLKYYWRKPDKTAESIRGGWYHTGDTAYRDAEGYFYFCGRNDDMLRVGGMWVAPSEVEAAVMSHPSVLEVAVVGAEDDSKIIKPKAFVVLRDPSNAGEKLEKEIIQVVAQQLPGFKCPRSVTFMPDLPKTATGKIQRFRLR